MAQKKKDSETSNIEERMAALEKKVAKIETERVYATNNQFEVWVDNKVRGFQYGPDLKKVVMPQSIGKSLEESRKIFYTERDKMVKQLYPGKPTPPWV